MRPWSADRTSLREQFLPGGATSAGYERRNGHPTIPSTDSAFEVIEDYATAAQEPGAETVAPCAALDHLRAARQVPSSPAVKSLHA
jgi:hypothetical protein